MGTLTAGFTSNGLALLSFSDIDTIRIPRTLQDFIIEKRTTQSHLELKAQLDAYFSGLRTTFDIKLDLHGTNFQKKVWSSLQDIPFGVTRSYKEQAHFFGDVNAIRAVASANGANPVVIVVPCHRVIGSNQTLTGYVGGLERKRYLLDLESKQGKLF